MLDELINSAGRFGARTAKELAIRYARVPGAYCFVKSDYCNGCGTCVRKSFCRMNAISVVERKARVNERLCRGCARCTHLCPRGALAMELRPPRVVKDALKLIDDTVSGRP